VTVSKANNNNKKKEKERYFEGKNMKQV